jgi:hypothetical protein
MRSEFDPSATWEQVKSSAVSQEEADKTVTLRDRHIGKRRGGEYDKGGVNEVQHG